MILMGEEEGLLFFAKIMEKNYPILLEIFPPKDQVLEKSSSHESQR